MGMIGQLLSLVFGGGGNVIALVTVGTADAVREALLAAGAKRVIVTSVAG